jgi:putative oxidoreductase
MITISLGQLESFVPLTEMLLRIGVGLLLIPHGLRMAFGFFPNTGMPTKDFRMTMADFDQWGYRPGWLWAPAVACTHLIAGPLLVLGLFTRLAAIAATIFLIVACFERWRIGRWFWNKLGMEYTLLWALAALHVLTVGGGPYSLDAALGL